MKTGSLHELRGDAYEYAWDNSVEPALELESGEAVLLHVRDASDEQIGEHAAVEDVLKLDFTHVNPVSGPIFVKGALLWSGDSQSLSPCFTPKAT